MVARQSFRGTVPVYQQKSLLQPSAWLASVSECLVQVLAWAAAPQSICGTRHTAWYRHALVPHWRGTVPFDHWVLRHADDRLQKSVVGTHLKPLFCLPLLLLLLLLLPRCSDEALHALCVVHSQTHITHSQISLGMLSLKRVRQNSFYFFYESIPGWPRCVCQSHWFVIKSIQLKLDSEVNVSLNCFLNFSFNASQDLFAVWPDRMNACNCQR